jgi:NAD(P)-dependent dehydrogenase (short-subunit alcohol dehydrogenase family)
MCEMPRPAANALTPSPASSARYSILVNNAGINRRNPFTADREAVAKDWQDVLSVNLNGAFNVTHAFLDQLRATKGRIVNIASVQSFMHVRTPASPAYTASKHGVLGLTRALAAELGRYGIRVNAIGPGLIETPLECAGTGQQSRHDEDFSWTTRRSAVRASPRIRRTRRFPGPRTCPPM